MKKILIIEDDDFLRSLAVTKLQKAMYTVIAAADGKTGLDMVIKEKPDLLLLDLLLPVMDGFTALETIRKTPDVANTRVVIFSNLGAEEDMRRGKELGVNDYLVKASFTLDELVDKIKSILG